MPRLRFFRPLLALIIVATVAAVGWAEPADGPGGIEIGKGVLKFLRVLQPHRTYTIKSTDNQSFAWNIKYEVSGGGEEKEERAVFVTLDGRYMSNEIVDIRQRIDALDEAHRIGRCLRDKEVRVYVDPAQEASRKQVQALGIIASYVVVDCGGKRKALCKRLGHESFPAAIYKGKGEIGVRRIDWFTLATNCR